MPTEDRKRSLTAWLFLLAVWFIAVPVAIYLTLAEADRERQTLLLQSVRDQGHLAAVALSPLLSREERSPLNDLQEALAPFATRETKLKMLFRPADAAGEQDFYFVAAAPPANDETLSDEREALRKLGVLDQLSTSCSGDLPLAERYSDPAGKEEIWTSITPVQSRWGCWALVVSHPLAGEIGATLGKPYWARPEMQVAAAIYFALAGLVFAVFGTVRSALLRVHRLAQAKNRGESATASFTETNRLSELSGVAGELDRLVGSLQRASDSIRAAAQDNAHAFKTPLAIMRQSMEPLRRLLADSGPRGQRALSVMEGALERLDHLVATARRVDETTAELLDPPRRRIDLSALVERTLEGYSPLLERQNLELEAFVAPGIQIRGGEDLLENVLENIVDNAISVSPRGGRITVVLTKPTDDTVELLLSDEGPGVPPELLDRIFDRSFSTRQQRTQPEAANAESGTSWHAGIGLWVVRRNIAAMGGWVYADNNADRGLTVRFTLPSAN
jgi:two-component system, OmpR family, sensor histidine kinase ChvG